MVTARGASRRFIGYPMYPPMNGEPPDETTLADIDTLCERTGEPNSKGG